VTGAGVVVRPARVSRSLCASAVAETTIAVLAFAGIGVLLARQFRAPGAEMDEGAVLAYSGRVLHGAVAWRDFQTFYGPGNLWLVGLVSKLFGLSIATERAVGLCYRLAVVLALYLVARRFGRMAGTLSLAISAFLVPGQGIAALALWGSLAFALGGLSVLVAAASRATGRRRDLLLGVAGALSAFALLVRFDLAPAVAVATVVLLPLFSWRERRRLLLAFAIVSLAYVPQVWLVGLGDLERLARQLRATEPGRRLPFPTPGAYPGMVLAPALVATVLLVVVGVVLVRKHGADLGARTLLAIGMFSASLLPTAMSRLDGTHVIPFAVVPLALLPALVTTLVGSLRRNRERAIVPFAASVAALGVCAASVLVALGAGPSALTAAIEPQPLVSYRVTVGSRWFPVGERSEAQAMQSVVAVADKLVKPGQSLFVGPVDLRRTNYNDTYVYFLLSQLRPASFYMEMNPQTANLPSSGLARQLRSADWLILTRRYDSWPEHNSSARPGSPVPGRVVARDFCVVSTRGRDVLLRRCR
jgi:hypothetical protein